MGDRLMNMPETYRTNCFYASIADSDGNSLSGHNLITGFSVNGRKISVVILDAIQGNNIEKMLDSWLNGMWMFKKRITITLRRLDMSGRETYTVTYENCRLKRYGGNGFDNSMTNSGSNFGDEHQWHAEFICGRKKIKAPDRSDNAKPAIHPGKRQNTPMGNGKGNDKPMIANGGKVPGKIPETRKRDGKAIDNGKLRNIEENINSMITRIEDKLE